MKRNVYVAVTLLVLLAVLGFGSAVLEKRAAVEAAAVQAPRFEVDPLWPKPLPNHWILGQTIGVSVDAQDHVWIIHRAGSLEPSEAARDHESAHRPVLRSRSADSRIRSGRQPPQTLGRPRRGLRVAGLEPRHHRRLQRQRLDRRERPRPRLRTGGAAGRPAGRGQNVQPDESQTGGSAATSTTTWC